MLNEQTLFKPIHVEVETPRTLSETDTCVGSSVKRHYNRETVYDWKVGCGSRAAAVVAAAAASQALCLGKNISASGSI